MKCHLCGGEFGAIVTDMPFKLSQKTIVILKELPVMECDGCSEFQIEDHVMERIEAIFDRVDKAAEVEIVQFAA
ncbi:MAG: YgiT-type zinc finger protein [Nitrospinota bacterium]